MNTLLWFAQQMLYKLQANSHKTGCNNCTLKWLLYRLGQENGELRRAVKSGNMNDVIKEAADVANFAMMIADNANKTIESKRIGVR